MFKRGLVLSLVLSIASVANAGGTFLELVPATPGPYAPGSNVDVGIVFHNMEGSAIDLRLAQVDFGSSQNAVFDIPDFAIDLSSLPFVVYSLFPTDMATGNTIANVTWPTGTPIPGALLSAPDGGTINLGTITIGLPDAPGVYPFDVVNPDAPDNNSGARFDYSFTNRVTLWPIAGGTTNLEVVPEPATLALLGIGGIAMLRRRRKNA